MTWPRWYNCQVIEPGLEPRKCAFLIYYAASYYPEDCCNITNHLLVKLEFCGVCCHSIIHLIIWRKKWMEIWKRPLIYENLKMCWIFYHSKYTFWGNPNAVAIWKSVLLIIEDNSFRYILKVWNGTPYKIRLIPKQ